MKFYLDFKRTVSIGFIFLLNLGLAFSQADELMSEADGLFAKGKYDEAIEVYGKVLEEDPEKINAYLQRGLAFNITKKYEMAVQDYNKVLSMNPGIPAVLNSRGSMYMKMENYEAAMADFNAVISSDDKNQEAYNNRGWCKKYLGDDKGACDDWKKSKKLGNGEAKIILKNNGC
jgi:tetratricopeptide (TPR) repeat protein